MRSSERDVFLSHASEDKNDFVLPFAEELDSRGITYWLDEAQIGWGDKITQKINDGLSKARYVVVFLSQSFVGKNWPESELAAALNKENTEGKTVVLPLILRDADSVFSHYPLLRDKAYLKWTEPLSGMVDQLQAVIVGEAIVARGPKNPVVTHEPTITDLLYEMRHEGFGEDLFRLLASESRRRGRGVPASRLLDTLPNEFRAPFHTLMKNHADRTAAILDAIRAEPPSDGSLQIVSIGWTPDAEFDVMLRNLSDDTVYITNITVRVLAEKGAVRPALQPSAEYEIPVGHLAVGESNGLDVFHIIEPHMADRFLISLRTTSVLRLRLTLAYNKHFAVSENAWSWFGEQLS